MHLLISSCNIECIKTSYLLQRQSLSQIDPSPWYTLAEGKIDQMLPEPETLYILRFMSKVANREQKVHVEVRIQIGREHSHVAGLVYFPTC